MLDPSLLIYCFHTEGGHFSVQLLHENKTKLTPLYRGLNYLGRILCFLIEMNFESRNVPSTVLSLGE